MKSKKDFGTPASSDRTNEFGIEDVANALDSPVLLLDKDTRIRKWNSACRKLLELTGADAGMPLGALPSKLGAGQLPRLARRLLARGEPFTRRVSIDNRVFRVRGSPAPGGVALLFTEATAEVRAERRGQRRNAGSWRNLVQAIGMLEAIPGQAALLDARGVIVAVNADWRRFAGRAGGLTAGMEVGRNYLTQCEEAAREGDTAAQTVAEALRRILEGTIPRFHEDFPGVHTGEGGGVRRLIAPLPGWGGALVFQSEANDGQARIEELAADTPERAREPDSPAILIVDSRGDIGWVNEAHEFASGYTAAEAAARGGEALCASPGLREILRNLRHVQRAEAWRGEVTLASKSGERYQARQTIAPVWSQAGAATHFVVVQESVTDRPPRARARFTTGHDELTGLWNRKSFRDLLARAVDRHKGSGWKLAVFFVDIGRFQQVNDTLGHHIGDQVLTAVARRLRQSIRPRDTMARFSGDEFAILVESISGHGAALQVARSLLSAFDAPIEAGGRELPVTASVGATLFPDDATTAEALLRNADLATREAKARGRHGHKFFEHGLESVLRERVEVERELSRCVRDSQLWVAFQPQTRLDTGETAGAECLVRWNRGEALGVPVSKMVQIAEECGMILPIGYWVLCEAFSHFAKWRAAGHPIEMALNLSAVQLHEQDVYGILTGLAAQHGVPLHAVKVEITESVLLNRGGRVKETMEALRSAGVGLVLDDFGTGYASLSYLQQFPISTLKIDSSFVRGIGGSASDEAIVRGVVKLAHSLGQDVVAEGVETRLQLDFLRDCGCDRAQGYLFSPGLPAEEFFGYLGRPALPPS